MIKNIIGIILVTILFLYLFPKGEEYEKHTISIDEIMNIGELFIAKITIFDLEYIYIEDNIISLKRKEDIKNKYSFILIIKGFLYYSVNFKNVKIIKQDKNTISLVFDKPKFEVELDENKTSPYLESEKAKIDDDILFRYSEIAEGFLENKGKYNLLIARKQAEEFITGYLKQFDYTVKKVYWRDLVSKNLSKKDIAEKKKDIQIKLILCNEKNDLLDKLNLNYEIRNDGSIKELVITPKVSNNMEQCIKNSLKKVKYKEFYNNKTKVTVKYDDINLNKSKMCKELANDSWFNLSSKEYKRLLNCNLVLEKHKNNNEKNKIGNTP